MDWRFITKLNCSFPFGARVGYSVCVLLFFVFATALVSDQTLHIVLICNKHTREYMIDLEVHKYNFWFLNVGPVLVTKLARVLYGEVVAC